MCLSTVWWRPVWHGTLPLVAFAAATLVSLLRQMSRDREKSLEETGVAFALLALLACIWCII